MRLGYYYNTVSPVLFDNSLPHAARSLYCLLQGLTQETGYCWASNEYLAKPFDWTKDYVTDLIKKLKEQGHIQISTVTKQGKTRRSIKCTYVREGGRVGHMYEEGSDICSGETSTDVRGYNNDERIKRTHKVERDSSEGSDDPSTGSSPVLPKVNFKKRYSPESLPYKLAELLINLVSKRHGCFNRYLASEEGQYLLIQQHAKHFDLILNRDGRDVNELLEVLQWSQEDQFWKGNIMSGETFRRQYTILLQRMKEQGAGSLAPDENPELTRELIRTYRGLIAEPRFQPSPSQHSKFISASEKMIEFFSRHREIDRANWCSCLMECLEQVYLDKGEKVYPGHFCSDHIWSILMPQYLLDSGLIVWEEEEEPV